MITENSTNAELYTEIKRLESVIKKVCPHLDTYQLESLDSGYSKRVCARCNTELGNMPQRFADKY